ncbi:S41 family peptidase [Sphingobacterium thalpophilum]|uniref:S41 family peptidase n=1 Tax=Sphingobacterium thalpophilum TaxID=259 RepID=UPI0024A6D496|nr:S41 family peptidase [Sphingobacterium thalpophilum]
MRISKLNILLILFFSFSQLRVHAQQSEIRSLVVSFLDTVENNSYMSNTVNWDSLRPALLEKTKNITELSKLKPIFNEVIKGLGDAHSSVFFNEQVLGDESESNLFEKLAKTTDKEAGLPEKVYSSRLLEGGYGYIKLPDVFYEQRKYVDTIKQQIQALDQLNPKAWIIDLTENSDGGSVFPMIWHLANLIDTDYTYSIINNKGKEERVPTKQNNLSEKEQEVAKLFDLQYEQNPAIAINNNRVPIIVLTSGLTVSASEFLVAHFKGQKNVRIVGQTTAGNTSANYPYIIGENFQVNLTVAVIKDRTGQIYKIKEGIKPDIPLEIDFAEQLNLKEIKTYNEWLLAVKKAKPLYLNKAIEVIKCGKF